MHWNDGRHSLVHGSCHSVNVVIHSIVYLPVMGQLCLKIILFP